MGVTFLGRRFSEADLLAAAGALETRTRDQRQPPTQIGVASPASCDAAGQAPFLTPTTRVKLRLHGTRARVAVTNGPIFRVRVTARDRHGRIVLRGRVPRVDTRARVRLHRVRRGRARHAFLVARDPSDRSVSAFRRLRG
jgi:hypothetical protein